MENCFFFGPIVQNSDMFQLVLAIGNLKDNISWPNEAIKTLFNFYQFFSELKPLLINLLVCLTL